MTDLRHVGELLHAAAMTEQMGATALTAWLRARVLEAARDNNNEERSRRLESDAEAVQVLTDAPQQGSRVPGRLLPGPLGAGHGSRTAATPVTFHDAAGRRTIDVGLEGPQWAAHVQQHLDEQRGEDLRLAYVALTRAKHQAVVWWAGSWESRDSALSRLLFARDDDGNVASSGRRRADRRGRDRALPGAGGRGAGARQRRAVGARGDRVVAGRRDRDVGAVGVLVRSRARLVVAADVVQRHHRRHLRGAGGERAGGGRSSTTSPHRTRRRSRTTARMSCERCRRCSPRCRWGSRSGRWSTASSSRRTSRRRISTSELVEQVAAAQARRRVELGDLAGVGRGAARGDRDAARADGGRHRPARRHARRPARRARLRAAAGRRRRPERAGADPVRDRRRAARALAAGRSARGLRRAPARPAPALERARLPRGQHRPRPAAPRRALRRRRLQDQLARAPRRGPDRLAPPPGRAQRRDDPLALRPPGAALHRRAAPLPALAAAGLLGRAQPRRRAVPVHARDDGAGHAGRRRRAVRRVHLAAVGRARRGAERRARPGASA